ncbi:T-cell leukemia translocation-altered gene protein homolog isoform X1 [Hemiscyllium ocellatum]|uniref:T-cell leukemia translocation-altered gene protein homolog isoform X1 n=1 Tax=Hemiscyllium ocellatum TaxID=170820 RepID=UPI002966B59E|nr:T-cell leukemia translocation-altered gene protein homolog isoform X1 [Hemiscyllium ocellatum]XP_060691360.1 T-cell leukemia translocation-altered gene protein homolog isoform X1 [Hemiscyllium ocellatum]XP_060691361.1 T-cell leukemia translocation-altered gene protein homolog isoform X1 [Hemiscyllium ocellatum]
MEAPSWDLGLFSFLLERLLSFCSEFAQDWSSNDMRVTIFKILLGWLLGSLVAIHMAWKFYGATVNDMYYRQVYKSLWHRRGRLPIEPKLYVSSAIQYWRSEWRYSRQLFKLYQLGQCQWRVN